MAEGRTSKVEADTTAEKEQIDASNSHGDLQVMTDPSDMGNGIESAIPSEQVSIINIGAEVGLAKKSNSQLEFEEPPGEGEKMKLLPTIILMSALCFSVMLTALDVTIIATAIPSITSDFQSSSGYTWIGSSYMLGAAAFSPSWGKLSDIWGRKPILLIAIAVFFIGSLLCGVSVSITMLIVGRAVQGVASGGLALMVNVVISDLFSLRRRGTYYGIIGFVWGVAGNIGPLLGGALSTKASWRWCFYINCMAFIVVFCVLKIHTPKTPIIAGLKAIDWLGSIAIIGSTLMFLIGLELGGIYYPWASPTVLCLLVFGIITAGLFVLFEWKVARYPVIPLHLLNMGSHIGLLVVLSTQSIVFTGCLFYLPLYFQAVLGADALLSGVYLLPLALCLSIMGPITGYTIRKTGKYLELIKFGMIIMTLGVGLFIDLGVDRAWVKIIIYQIIAGIGTGPNFQSPLIAFQAIVPQQDVAAATAMYSFMRNLSTAISMVIGGVVFQNGMENQQSRLRASLGDETAELMSGSNAAASVLIIKTLPQAQMEVARKAFSHSLKNMWTMYVCISTVGAVASFFIRKKKLSKQHPLVKTGLETEELKRRGRKEQQEQKRKPKQDVLA